MLLNSSTLEESPIPIRDDLISAPVAVAINTLSIILFVLFLWSFVRMPQKKHGDYMILILIVSDLSLPIVKIITIFFLNKPIPISILGPITFEAEGFKLYWTAALSLFTYLVYHSFLKRKSFNYKIYLGAALFCCILSTLALNLHYRKYDWQLFGKYTIEYKRSDDFKPYDFLIRDVLGRVVPILATFIFYSIVYILSRKSYQDQISKKKVHRRIFFYSFIPILCFGPSIFNHANDAFNFLTFSENAKSGMNWLILILQYSWEFLNLWFYWVMRPKADNQENQEKYMSESIETVLIPKQKSFISQL